MGLDKLRNPILLVEERDGGVFLHPAVAMPVRDLPKSQIKAWIARDEAEMKAFQAAGKAREKVRLFLDTSVLLTASGSGKGASRFLMVEAATRGWELVSSDYCEEETRRNLPKLGRAAAIAWRRTVRPRLRFIRASLSLDKPLVFPRAKDRPVIITALAARSDWLLTLDEADFHGDLGQERCTMVGKHRNQ